MIEWDWLTYFLFASAMTFAFFCLRQYDLNKEKNQVSFLILGLLPCLCLFAFRHPDVGRDLIRYAQSIEFAKYGAHYYFFNFSGSLATEPLSRLIKFVSFHLGGIKPFIIITSILQYLFVYIFLRKLHLKGFDIAFLFLLYFSIIQLRSCSMVRNGLALSASFCAYAYLFTERKSRYFWLFAILGFGFHNSAIINIPIYFVCQPIQGGYWKVVRNISLKIFALLFVVVLIYALKSGMFSEFLLEIADAKYARYEMSNSWGVGNFIIRMPLLLLFCYSLKEIKTQYGQCVMPCIYLMFFDLVISQSRYVYSDLERLTQYTIFGVIFFVTIFFDFIRKKFYFPFQFVCFLIVLICFTYYMYHWSVEEYYGLMPYKFMEW